MRRLLKSIYVDIFMQMKYGFYTVYGVVSILYIVILKQLPHKALMISLPLIIFSDPGLLGFYFISGLVLFEKGENILEYLIVTPLRSHEYLISKMISLTILSLVTSIIISFLSYGLKFNILLFSVGVILTSLFFILIGFIAVAKFPTINEYLLSSIIYIMVFCIPVVGYFGLYNSRIFYIFPTQASLLLIRGAFVGIEPLKIIYSIVYLIICIFIAYKWAHKSFNKFIIRKEGMR